jgi:hypothetical protein
MGEQHARAFAKEFLRTHDSKHLTVDDIVDGLRPKRVR